MEKNNSFEEEENKIYTGKGDQGKTEIAPGKKISKEDPLVKTWGILDQLEAQIGHLSAITENPKIIEELRTIQTNLHIIMAQITGKSEPKIKKEQTELLEEKIDEYTEKLPELKRFIYTSGAQEATYAQVARTTARKAERKIVELDKKKGLSEEIKQYLNRLSDYLFTVGRYLNYDQGIGDEYVEYD
ncbi:MAG: cob(I)yrinic acid a,c-diamide adenosyltransferase [archaeon]